ncbi:hypothetical protein bcere0025_61420 [Bacillus cereus F65185]|nr:hypothetical protein bcere0025_61420 [Bacillus cereus F65185]
MFLHEIGKKLIQITLYLSNYENRLYFVNTLVSTVQLPTFYPDWAAIY